MPEEQHPAVDVICDLRLVNMELKSAGDLEALWRHAGDLFVGQPLTPGRPLQARLPQGALSLWVVGAAPGARVEPDTAFNVVDVLRSPRLLYHCRVCGKYGPLRCAKCEDEKRPERLCDGCAHKIKDELSAFCPDHIPRCNCRPGCTQPATFRCGRRQCRNSFSERLFGDHYRRQNPRDPDADYCLRCYEVLFEQCVVCKEQGKFHLGKSKCAYKTRASEGSCAVPLCWGHSFQWKIWGPHNRGVTLCTDHKQRMGVTDPADLLFMMLTTRPPHVRGKRMSLPNPFRLRRIVNRNRPSPLSFDHIGRAFNSISGEVDGWGSQARRNFDHTFKVFTETTGGLSRIEADLLYRVKAFYQQAAGWDAASQIVGLEIIDRFYKPGQPDRYRVKLHLSTTNKGPFIGRGGSIINQLRAQLNVEVDI